MLGHETWGNGGTKVIVLNDWLGDTSSWSAARAYLDLERFTWHFVDLRGYGRSKTQAGAYDLEEAVDDVLALADSLKLRPFVIVGHSMSTYVAMELAQHHADRVSRAVLLTPGPPAGFGADEAALAPIRALARGDDAVRLAWLEQRFGEQWSPGWARAKLRHWRASSSPEAVATYAALFVCRGLPDPAAPITVPTLAVTGERDVEVMRREAVQSLLAPICRELTVAPIELSGHYPMQETPPLLVTLIERFLAPPKA